MSNDRTVVRPPLVVKDVIGMFLTFAEWRARVAAEWAWNNGDRPSGPGTNGLSFDASGYNAALDSVELIQIAAWLRAHPNECARLQAAVDRADHRQLGSALGPVLLRIPLDLPLVSASASAVSTACRKAFAQMMEELEDATEPSEHHETAKRS